MNIMVMPLWQVINIFIPPALLVFQIRFFFSKLLYIYIYNLLSME